MSDPAPCPFQYLERMKSFPRSADGLRQSKQTIPESPESANLFIVVQDIGERSDGTTSIPPSGK